MRLSIRFAGRSGEECMPARLFLLLLVLGKMMAKMAIWFHIDSIRDRI